MGKLKKLIFISALLLFIILSLNLAAYFYLLRKVKQKDIAETGYYISSSQQVLIQQLSRKVSVVTIHHYFSEGQFKQQVNEIHDLVTQLSSQQATLKNLFNENSLPGRQAEHFQSSFNKAAGAFTKILLIANTELGKAPSRSEDDETQQSLRLNEAVYLSAMQSINGELRLIQRSLDHELNKIRDAMVISLITGLILLTLLLIVPAIRLNTKTYNELKATLEGAKIAERVIKESELKYRQLFQMNPMPMWIFDMETLRFLEVNERTIQHYGYSREEFSRMTALDIRPERERNKLQNILPTLKDEDQMYILGKWIHQRKNGEEIIVEIITHKIKYNNRDALLVLANDITRNVQLQKELLDTKIDQQREIAKAALSVQEKERNEIGKELHDNVNQILTSVKLHLELIDVHGKEKHLPKSIELVSTAIQEIRRLSKSLVPPTFNDMGLLTAIEDLVENVRTYQSTFIHFMHINFEEENFDNDFKLTLFRIIQEQLTNVVKHANAKEVTIHLEQDERQVYLIITDDGQGFDKQQKKKGIGISNIVNRADAFGGVVHIETRPGEGCSLQIRFPVKEKEMRV